MLVFHFVSSHRSPLRFSAPVGEKCRQRRMPGRRREHRGWETADHLSVSRTRRKPGQSDNLPSNLWPMHLWNVIQFNYGGCCHFYVSSAVVFWVLHTSRHQTQHAEGAVFTRGGGDGEDGGMPVQRRQHICRSRAEMGTEGGEFPAQRICSFTHFGLKWYRK